MASVIRSLRYAYRLLREQITLPHFMLGQKPNALRLFHAQGTFGFVTFALDKNPVCSMVHGSKLTGEPDAKISLQGRSKIK